VGELQQVNSTVDQTSCELAAASRLPSTSRSSPPFSLPLPSRSFLVLAFHLSGRPAKDATSNMTALDLAHHPHGLDYTCHQLVNLAGFLSLDGSAAARFWYSSRGEQEYTVI